MRRLRILAYLIVGCFFINADCYAIEKPVINLSIDNDHVFVGQVIKLELTVKADRKSVILWKLFNEVFEQSEKITLLSDTSLSGDGIFKHQIFFTSAKPLKLSVGQLGLTIDNEKVLTPPFKVEFKADKLPLKLHDIKPVEAVNWWYMIKAYLFNGLVLVLLLLVIAGAYIYIKRWINVNAPIRFKQNCLKKLSALESATNKDTLTVAALINQVFDLLREFLHVEKLTGEEGVEAANESDYPPALYKFVETANQLKFLPQPAAKLLYQNFISDIREFITTHQPKTQDDR